jgi:hypothetical protein
MVPSLMGTITSPCLGVTGGDYVSRSGMENMIYTMIMMISISIDDIPTTP